MMAEFFRIVYANYANINYENNVKNFKIYLKS